MADPVSLGLGVLPLIIQAIQASRTLLEFMADIKGAPGLIKAVNKEVHTFYNVLFSLSVVLKDQDVQTAINGNKTLLETVETLDEPIKNCRAILGQLSVKLEKLRGSNLVGTKWSLFSKNEISKLQQMLEAEKSTISAALNVINMMTSMRVLAFADKKGVISEAPTGENLEYDTIMSPLAHASRETSLLQLSKPRIYNNQDLEKTLDKSEATYRSMIQISESIEAIVHGTQHAIMSEDRLLHRENGFVYQDLNKADVQVKQLRSLIRELRELRENMTAAASSGNKRTSKFEYLESRWSKRQKSNSAVVEVFFDCFSSFTSQDADPSIDELQIKFYGSPEYRFESLPSFYPEQYVSEGSITNELFAVAMLPSMDNLQTFRYFLYYAETARRWQRVVIHATFHGGRQQIDTLRVAAPDEHIWGVYKRTLPSAVHSLLRRLLPFIEFYSSITRISLDLKVSESGQIMPESERIEVIEEESGMSKSDEMDFLKYMNSVCCKRSYKVYVGSEACIERKILFANGKKQGNTIFLDYFEEIKHLISLCRCANVSEFRGVVLDDTRRHVRSYLKELPLFKSVRYLLTIANSRSRTIPLPIRELWARHLIQAVIEIHSQGLIAGVFYPDSVGIRADGTAIFHRLRPSEKYLQNNQGRAPPEMRQQHRDDYSGSSVQGKMNFHTDIFQLGLVLRMISEHMPQTQGYFCALSACTHWPRRTCMAPHANPVGLPACSDNTPAYLCDIIRRCRVPEPQSRVSAGELAHILSTNPQPEVTPADIQQALTPYMKLGEDFGYAVYCDECGELTTKIHYHCNICFNNDYDICQACFEKGRRCLVGDHRLIKTKKDKNDFIDISR